MQTVESFKLGDKVRHPNGAVGRVMKFGPEGACLDTCVHVNFDPVPKPGYPKRKWQGAYPNTWFRTNELEIIND